MEGAARACRIYLITPPRFEPSALATRLDAALDGGDIACVQLCMPEASDAAVRDAAAALMPPCHAREVAFVVEGRPDIAAETGAEGVHLEDEGAVAATRRRLGRDAIIGASCSGSRHRAMVAGEAGADYVSFGAFFASPTRPQAAVVSPEILTWWSELMELPCVAVGGITAANCAALVRAGADFLAVCSAVWHDPAGPGAAVAALNEAVERARASC